ncbi:MAG: hypothetical protein HYU30_08005 [Chloroflexi bacterium]|nr:hypothetical protein [Chloroflexota bacterium]
MDTPALVLGGVIGFVASFLAYLVGERLRRPRLTFQIGEWADGNRGDDSWRFVHINVLNTARAPWCLAWLAPLGLPPRYAASNCQARVSYLVGDSEVLALEGRWSTTPEPLTPMPESFRFDPTKVGAGQRENISYGEGSQIVVGLSRVMKKSG